MQRSPLSLLPASERKRASAIYGRFPSLMSSSRHSPVLSTLTLANWGAMHSDGSVQNIEQLPGHLHPIHVIHFSNDVRLVVKTSPPSWTPLLRHESAQLATEAAALSLLAKSSLPIPELVRYEPLDPHVGSSFLLTVYLAGISYASIRQDLTVVERAGIERQIRSVSDAITQYTSPTFGPVNGVADGRGFETWDEAFTAMIEDVLMDGEDMLVALPFTEIRHLMMTRTGRLFQEVQQARLVVRGLGEEQNVLIDRQTHEVIGLVDLGLTFWGDGEWAARSGERGVWWGFSCCFTGRPISLFYPLSCSAFCSFVLSLLIYFKGCHIRSSPHITFTICSTPQHVVESQSS